MVVCPNCSSGKFVTANHCSLCDFSPKFVEGFRSWAPEFAKLNDGFPQESFERLARIEENHFWFEARNLIILWALRTYSSSFESMLEVGCGTGLVLSSIADAFPGAQIVGSDIYTAGLTLAARRLSDVYLFQMDARKIPYEAEFDVVGAFDVIEHILEDELVLKNFYRTLKPGGVCLITVPQHKWLWSQHDVAAHHKRRYSATELHLKVEGAGFDVLRSTSFVTFLLPLMFASRYFIGRFGRSTDSEFVMNPLINRFMRVVMKMERLIIKSGMSLPWGGSRLVVLKRRS
jgi:ubiquinone/menaquinone biosynthesis C-methylase UbiE